MVKFLGRITLTIMSLSVAFCQSGNDILAIYDYSYYKIMEPFKCACCKENDVGIKYEVKSLDWEHNNYLVFCPDGNSGIRLCMKCAWKDAKKQVNQKIQVKFLTFPNIHYFELDDCNMEIDLPMAFPASASGTSVDKNGKKIKMNPGYASCEGCGRHMSLLKGNYYYFECPDCQKILCNSCNKHDKINSIPNLCGSGPWCRKIRKAERIYARGNKKQILNALKTWWKNLAMFLILSPNAQDFTDC